jgi:hypothetical protein
MSCKYIYVLYDFKIITCTVSVCHTSYLFFYFCIYKNMCSVVHVHNKGIIDLVQ